MQTSDLSKWRLRVKEGRQTWHFEPNNDAEQSNVEKYWLGMLSIKDDSNEDNNDQNNNRNDSAYEAALRGMRFFGRLQTEDGHWAGEYGGPMFLTPGLVAAMHVAGVAVDDVRRVEIVRYVLVHEAKDGGWGLHIEGDATMLGSVLNYVMLRLLGVDADLPAMSRARAFIRANGGASSVPSWGKFWLAVLNLYHWDGVHPLLPELWMLPYAAPFHPARTWCHARQIYLPMSYCYAHRIIGPLTPLIEQIRAEIYVKPYNDIDWVRARDEVCPVDVYAPHHYFLDYANSILNFYERYHSSYLRQKALKVVVDHVRADDLNTKCISIGPISKVINMLVIWHHDGADSHGFKNHVERIDDYLWMNYDGMRMQGTNGSQLWDTALAMHAVLESGLVDEEQFRDIVIKAMEFIDDAQIKQNTPDQHIYFRQPNKGAFPFSTRDCGWIVSDCTAEGLKALLYLQNHPSFPKMVEDYRIYDAVDILLGMQNSDGGFASYEKRRGPFWLEVMNPSEVFGEIMVDYSYTECSSAVTMALHAFRKFYPEYRRGEIDKCIETAVNYVRGNQEEDGSWFGQWGICYTYATWFALEALACVGETYQNSDAVRRACDFLISKQLPDGGWGESYLACLRKEYIHHPDGSQVVMTSWAMMALLAANYPHEKDLKRAAGLLMKRQQRDGRWLQEGIEGVFNKTCMIKYPNYKFIFPIWALGKYARKFGDSGISEKEE